MQTQAIMRVLAPTGVRKKKLIDTIAEVSKGLCETAEKMGLPPIVLDDSLDVFLGYRRYVALSGSEQWMVRCALQLEIARYDGSTMVLLDCFDTLYRGYQKRVIEALCFCEIPAVLFMAAAKPEDVPDFAKVNLGASYWIEGGTIVPLAKAFETEKAA